MDYDTLLTIIKYVLLGIDIFALVALVFCLLVGFFRGWRKGLICLVAYVIPLILLLILLIPLTNVVLDINIAGTTVREYIYNALVEASVDTNSLSDESKNLIEGMTVGVIKIAIFEVGLIICGILALINRLILKAIFKPFIENGYVDKEAKHKKVKTSTKLVGLSVGFFRYLFFYVIVIFPLIGLINLVDVGIKDLKTGLDVADKFSSSDTATTLDEETLTMLDEVSNSLQSSIVYNIAKLGVDQNTEITLPALYLGELSSIKANNVKTNIIYEYGNIRPVLKLLQDVSRDTEFDNNIITLNLTAEQINVLKQAIKSNNSIKLVSPLVKDILIKNYSTEENINEEIINILKDVDIISEIDILTDALVIIVEEMHSIEINKDAPYEILRNTALPKLIERLTKKLLESKVVDGILLDKLIEELKTKITDEELLSLVTKDNIKLLLTTDVKEAIEIYQTLCEKMSLDKVIFAEEKIDLENEDVINSLCDVIPQVFNFSFIKGNEEKLISYALKMTNEPSLAYDKLFENLDPNWQEEAKNLSEIAKEAFKFYNQNIKNKDFSIDLFIYKDENGNYTIMNLVESITKSDMLVRVGINYLAINFDDLVKDSVPQELKECIDFNKLKSYDGVVFKEEIERFIIIFDTLTKMNFFDESKELDMSEEYIDLLLDNIFSSILISSNEAKIVNYILDATNLNASLNELGITLELDNVNWQTEKESLKKVFKAIVAFGDITNMDFETIMNDRSEEMKQKVINLIEALGDSEIFSSCIYPILEKAISEIGYNITFTDTDKEQIKSSGWKNEITILYEIVDECMDYLNEDFDYQTIKGETITQIMLKASESVIASKVVGIVLNEILGENGLNIMPKNIDGSAKYDFTNRQVLKDTASSIGSLIDLNNGINKFSDGEMTEDDSINLITDTLKELGNNDVAKDIASEIIAEYLDEEDISDIDFEQEASVISSVYEEYKTSPDEFNIDDHPELKENIENSKIASSVLSLLGII